MIKFFRKIRLELMEQNKTAKYFKYAIGEIVLVVIGILIALWLNDINAQTKQRIEEIGMLKELKKDFQEDIVDFKINKRAYEIISSSVDTILKELESSNAYHDSLDHYFAGTFCWPIAIIHSSSFEVLSSKGVSLISNDSLRAEILRMHGHEYNSMKIWESQYNQDIYFNELLKRFESVNPWYTDSNGNTHRGKMKPNNYNALKTDTLYFSILKTMQRDADQLLHKQYSVIVPELQKLISQIDDEVKVLE